jgi:hypothetical protein
MRRTLLGIASLVLAISLLAACGGDEGDADAGGNGDGGDAGSEVSSPSEYMQGLCTAISDYQADLSAQNGAFQEELTGGSPNPEETKTAIIAFLDELSTRTQQLIDDVGALGTPDVDNGEEVRTTLTGAFDQVIALFDEAKADIEALPTDDPAAMAQGFTEIASKLQEASTEIQGSLGGFESPELDEAAAEVEACGAVL